MNQDETGKGPIDFNRRDFIRGASFGTLMMLMGGVPIQAEDKNAAAAGGTGYSADKGGAPLACAVIGCGHWGREILETLARLPNAPVVAVCDTYAPALRRAGEAAPKAEKFADYRQLLEKKEVQGVIVATPTHQHREIVLAALQAGKHVYCEAPLALTVEDARAIAQAARTAFKLNFQSGLQMRSDPEWTFLLPFIRSGSIGKTIMARSQWNKKDSWRRPSSSAERDKAVNWRLRPETSCGLIGEIGIHQVDLIGWFLHARPASVAGLGGILNWDDGREVADTIQSVFEYPGGVNHTFDCTLANSFDAEYNMLYGSDAAVMMRGSKAWMFKETDAPTFGWEVYARKDEFYQATGIALAADATKLVALAKKATEEVAYTNTPLHFALQAFVQNSNLVQAGVADYTASYGDDADGLRQNLVDLMKTKSHLPAAGYAEGFSATVNVIKANEAVVSGQKVKFEKEWFTI